MSNIHDAVSFLKECRTFFVATTEDGRPRVRPFGFVMEFEEKIYFVTGNQKPFFKQIKNNPYIEICGINDKSEWLRLSGKAVIDSRMEIKQKAFAEEPSLVYVYQNIDSSIFECFYIEEARAVFCSMTADQKEVSF